MPMIRHMDTEIKMNTSKTLESILETTLTGRKTQNVQEDLS